MIMDKKLREAPCGFISFDKRGYIVEVNKTFLRWTNYVEEDLIGVNIEYLLSKVNRMIFHSYFYPNISLYGYIEELFVNLKSKNNESVPYLINANLYEEDNLKRINCILLQMKNRINYELELKLLKNQMEEAYVEKNKAFKKLEDIYNQAEKKHLELIEINLGLIKISNTDKLTDIGNRRLFQEKLYEQIKLYSKYKKSFSLLIIDIDKFKKINDVYGHHIGDIILEKLAQTLKGKMREGDILARYGGEEFTVILPETNKEESILISERLNVAVKVNGWKEVRELTVSIGIATFTDNDTEKSIIKNADKALYYSKENGRNRSTHFDDLKLI